MSSTATGRAGGPEVHVAVREERPTDEEVVAGLAELLADVLQAEGAAPDAQVGLHLVDESEMTALNAEHMGAAGPTDVLSFPVDGVSGADAGPPSLVGDVVVCVQVAARNAPSHAGTLESELQLLVVHSALHLCGLDHDTPAAQTEMWGRERAHMSRLGITPPRDPWTPR